MLRCPWWLIACCALLGVVGCSREPQAPAPGEQPAKSAATAQTSSATAGSIPSAPSAPTAEGSKSTDSSLAVKRGMVSLAAGKTTYRPCDEKADLWLLDQTEGALRQIFPNANEQTLIYVEAYGERTQTPQDIATARGYPGAFILEEVLYAAESKEGESCSADAPPYVVAARGGDPSWSAEIREKEISWRQKEPATDVLLQIPAAADAEGTVSYRGVAEGFELEMEIEGQPCRDPQSGEYFAYSARASLNGKEFNGCARVGS